MALEYKQIVVRDHTEEELRELWRQEYCRQVIHTHDGVRVKFYDSNFDHAFYESSDRRQSANKKKHKDILSLVRLSRMLWIKDVLADPTADLRVGYNNKKHALNPKKRVAISKGDYVVIIEMTGEKKAAFVTAFVADNSIEKIKQNPKWNLK
jgi:hypothetical protein